MLNWFSKYRSPFAAKPASATKTATPTKSDLAAAEATAAAANKAQRKADTRAAQVEQDQAAWAPRWQAALGDDAALLKIALDCPVLTLRQSAVEALVSEDALRQAETAFRNKDRRIHQVAKRRFEAAVLQRESRAQGQGLLASAQALAGQGLVPVNHLVALDRDWAALNPALLEAPLIEAFTEARLALGGMAQAQAEVQQRTQRHRQQARQLLADLQAAGQALLADEAGPHDFSAQDSAVQALQALLALPDAPALDAAMALTVPAALQDAQVLQLRLQWLWDAAQAAAQAPQVPPVPAAAAHTGELAGNGAGDAVVDAAAADGSGADVAAADGAVAGLDAATATATAHDPAAELLDAAALPDAAKLPDGVGASDRAEATEVAEAAGVAEVAEAPAAPRAIDATEATEATEAPESPVATLADEAAGPSEATDVAEAAPAAARLDVASPQPAPTPEPQAASVATPWSALPPLGQAAWSAQLDQRYRLMQAARRPAPPERAPRRAAAPAPVWSAQQLDALARHLQQGEAALAEGHLAPLQRHLQAFEQALTRGPALSPGDALVQRADALQAEHQRLKGWQQWGGGRARDDLAAEAEVLARATAAAADPALADAPKLDLKAHAEAINALRLRWRELDRLGAAASQPLWLRFDAALKQAYQPLAERQAAQKAQRQQNLRERDALLAVLEAWPGRPPAAVAAVAAGAAADGPTGDSDGQSAGDLDGVTDQPSAPPDLQRADPPADQPGHPPAAQPTAPPSAQALDEPSDQARDPSNEPSSDHPADSDSWKDRIRVLDRFHNAWRQLGPLEHTVPAHAREPLRVRQQQALQRLEAPLQQARRDAAGRREALIQQAEALAARAAQAVRPAPDAEAGRRYGQPDASRRSGTEDVAQQVRNLQAEWQQQARDLPLARGVEAALWGRFRAALDAVFAQRQAVFQARDAEAAAAQAERETWITRLTDLPADAPAADARRLLAEADQAWRQAAVMPRGLAVALEGRMRDARAAVQQRLADATGRHWRTWCDALQAGLQQAVQREQAADAAAAAPGQLADLPPDLPAPWARALADRLAAPVAPGPLSNTAFDALMLPLEAALDMPATAEQQAARRLLKLQALKQTLEGRAAPATTVASPADALVAALRQAVLPEAQQQRVLAVVAALRRSAPGLAGLPQPRV